MPKKVIKKITQQISSQPEVVKVTKPDDSQAAEKFTRTKKTCMFCQSKTIPLYTDVATLKRFISDRAKIVSRLRSGVCSKHQRKLSKQIKYARHLSLLPFTPKV